MDEVFPEQPVRQWLLSVPYRGLTNRVYREPRLTRAHAARDETYPLLPWMHCRRRRTDQTSKIFCYQGVSIRSIAATRIHLVCNLVNPGQRGIECLKKSRARRKQLTRTAILIRSNVSVADSAALLVDEVFPGQPVRQ